MSTGGPGSSTSVIEPIPLELLREPLVWFFAEHYRHRDLCRHLERFAAKADCEPSILRSVLEFMETDLPVHILDEEEDFFPLLQRRCKPEDQIGQVLGMLSGEHTADLISAKSVRKLLKKAIKDSQGLAAYPQSARVIETFCQALRRHIAVENAVVLPIARLRLTVKDHQVLGQRLAARRGLPDPCPQAS